MVLSRAFLMSSSAIGAPVRRAAPSPVLTALLSLALTGAVIHPLAAQNSGPKAQAAQHQAPVAAKIATPAKPEPAPAKQDAPPAKPAPAAAAPTAAAPSGPPAVTQTPPPAATPPNQPATLRFSGSPAVGERLTGDLVKAFARTLAVPASRTVIGLDPAEYEIVARGGEGDKLLRAHIEARGTNEGPRALAAGGADIWMAARQITKDDVDEAAKHAASGHHGPDLNQLVTHEWEHVVALDNVVLMLSPRNPVKALSLPQLRDIFTGRIKTWSAAGGPELPITVFTPPHGASEFDSFCEMVMGMTDPAECEKAVEPTVKRQIASAADLSDEVAASAGGIGLGSAAFLRANHAVAINTECGVVAPASAGSAKGEDYPLVRPLYYYAAPSRDTEAARFLNFATSDAARPVIEAAGYIPVHAGAGDGYTAARVEAAGDARDGGRTRIRPADVGAFEEATQGATRLPIVLHFQPGSDDLDTRARADLQRLAALMRTGAHEKAELVLIGYSQALGDYATNHEISQRRVNAVKAALASNFSIKAAVAVGVGPAAPIACNLEPTGRFLNQRVEAWVRAAK
jgi:phosphate transport system substrate-binding protein